MGIFLLGCGEMGCVTGTDLLETYEGELTFADLEIGRAKTLAERYPKRKVRLVSVNVKDHKNLVKAIRDSGASIVINAVNYYFNLDVMLACLEAHANYIDLGGLFHTTLKQLELDKVFRGQDLLAIPGCGSSPGIMNVLAAFGARKFDKVTDIYVSFADKDYTKYNTPIVLPYSIQTLFDEFGEKPAVLRNGKIEFVEPLSGAEKITFPDPLNGASCFYTLHSEIATLPRSFGLKNCSFRGGFDLGLVSKVRFLLDAGFASDEQVKLADGQSVSPKKFVVRLMDRFVPALDIKINDLEFLRVELLGKSKGKKKKLVVYCESFTNKKWNIPAGSWNTGVAPSIIAQMIERGDVKHAGVVPPEIALNSEILFKELGKRDMKVWIARK